MLCIGIDIGGTKCAGTIGNENGEILWKLAIATTNATETLEQIYVLAKEAAGTAQAEYHTSPAAVGISCGGPLDSRRGLIQSPPNPVSYTHLRRTTVHTFFTRDDPPPGGRYRTPTGG